MARRADHKREELYEMALVAAKAIVEQHGFAHLTARNVAHAIGYSPGTLYNLFENLDDLAVHLNGMTLDALFAALRKVPLSGHAEADVRALCRCYTAFLDQNQNLCDLLFDNSYAPGYQLPDWYRQKISTGLEILATAMAPVLPPENHAKQAEAARTLWACLQGICSLSRNGKLDVIGAQSRAAMTDVLITNFMAGLRHHRSGL